MIAAGNDRHFAALCEALDLPGLPEDPRFATNPERVANRDALHDLVAERVATLSVAETLERLERVGVPGGAGPGRGPGGSASADRGARPASPARAPADRGPAAGGPAAQRSTASAWCRAARRPRSARTPRRYCGRPATRSRRSAGSSRPAWSAAHPIPSHRAGRTRDARRTPPLHAPVRNAPDHRLRDQDEQGLGPVRDPGAVVPHHPSEGQHRHRRRERAGRGGGPRRALGQEHRQGLLPGHDRRRAGDPSAREARHRSRQHPLDRAVAPPRRPHRRRGGLRADAERPGAVHAPRVRVLAQRRLVRVPLVHPGRLPRPADRLGAAGRSRRGLRPPRRRHAALLEHAGALARPSLLHGRPCRTPARSCSRSTPRAPPITGRSGRYPAS